LLREGSASGTFGDVRRGRPADALMELCERVDLLVIGSRRWGGAARVLLGRTGEALMHDASAAVLVVPRPEV
jgi:nucleotide-binding universal stress UspA family protein